MPVRPAVDKRGKGLSQEGDDEDNRQEKVDKKKKRDEKKRKKLAAKKKAASATKKGSASSAGAVTGTPSAKEAHRVITVLKKTPAPKKQASVIGGASSSLWNPTGYNSGWPSG